MFVIPGYEPYTTDGINIFNKRGKQLSQWMGSNGYFSVTLSNKNRKQRSISVHRVFALTYLDNPNNKPQVNHINGIKTDNRIESLEWNTSAENVRHSIDNKLRVNPSGQKHWNAKLTDGDIPAIRDMYSTGIFSQKQLGEIFGVDRRQIGRIVSRKRWKHIK